MLAATRTRHSQEATQAAALPSPLLSSRCRNWPGIVVELHHFRGVDALVPIREHVVGVHLSGSVNLLQARGRRTCIRAQDRARESAASRHRFANHRDHAAGRLREPQPPLGDVPPRYRRHAERVPSANVSSCIAQFPHRRRAAVFKAGKANGPGVYVAANGARYEGPFEAGKLTASNPADCPATRGPLNC